MDNSLTEEEENDHQGMETINAATELYPLKSAHWDDEQLGDDGLPFNTLCGEYICYAGLTVDGVIAMSNYRLYIKSSKCGILSVPLFGIDSVGANEFEFWIHCKNLHFISCKFSESYRSTAWFHRFSSVVRCVTKIEDLFAFAFYSWCCQEKEEAVDTLQRGVSATSMEHEIKRLGFDCDGDPATRTWRITKINEDYSFCPSYPSFIIVPNTINDVAVKMGAQFRSYNRFPAVVWRSRKNGCVIARCSQPEVGLFGWRGKEDEVFVQAIADACYKSNRSEDMSNVHDEADVIANCQEMDGIKDGEDELTSKLLIVDARSYPAAMVNRAKGGGSESPAYYDNCEVKFMSLPNIHYVRKSFIAVRGLCESYSDDSNWLTTLDSSKWLHYLAGLLQSAKCVVNAINNEKRPVVVHCSDGWDRTSQITALSELLLDPYYRTIEGFQVLVEREWIQFGHKFGDRCGYSSNEDSNERSPIFLQWLDCVHQLLIQYPCYFEFNETYLIKLAQHVYSCLFGTFLCNNDSERYKNRVKERTFSVWSLFKSYQTHFKNYLFTYVDKVLYPRCSNRDLVFWSNVYIPFENNRITNLEEKEVTTAVLSNANKSSSNMHGLIKTKSCDDLSVCEQNTGVASTRQRRLSDPNLHDIQCSNVKSSTSPEISTCADEKTDDISQMLSTESALTAESNLPTSNIDCKLQETAHNSTNLIETDLVSPEVESPSNSESISSLIEDSLKSKLLISAVNGSTDTLVSEGTMGSSSGKFSCDNSNITVNKMGCDPSPDETFNSELSRLSRSTSTTEISDSSLASSDVSCYKQSWMSGFHRSLSQSCTLNQRPKKYTNNRKTNNSSSLNSIYSSNSIDSRTPSSGFPATPSEECRVLSDQANTSARSINKLEDVDGLNLVTDHVQLQLLDLLNKHKSEIESLKRELYAARLDMCQQVGNRCNNNNGNSCPDHSDEVLTLPEAAHGELCSGCENNEAEFGWEHVNDKELNFSASNGADCWYAKPRHSCGYCGKIFCSKCSDHLAPIPDEQLYHPVRVCRECYQVLYTKLEQQPQAQWTSMSCSSGCKNRIGSKAQSVQTAEALN